MKLSYRGASYEAEPSTPEVTEGGIGGLYRGQPWKVHHYKENRRKFFAFHNLTYRGAAYRQQ